MTLADSHAPRIDLKLGLRPPQFQIRFVRLDGMKDRPDPTVLVPARLGIRPCSEFPGHKSVLCSLSPRPGTRSAGPPAPGPRRLPPAPPSHPAARLSET